MKGYGKHFLELASKFETPIHVIAYIVLFVGIIYVKEIPQSIKNYGNNLLVRLILFASIIGLTSVSFVHGMLLAMFVVLYLSFTPGMKESFEDLRIVAKKKQRWYDEQVIGENPELMETEKVRTEAIQGS